jgi:aminoglycoside phosphotransferase (APT) family kinase protein
VTEAALAQLPGRVEAALRRRWPDAGVDVGIGELVPLPGGISSLTFSTMVSGEARVVVKVAPPGLAPVRNRDVLRQARVMAAVHGASGVRVPKVLAHDDGSPPFFVMEFVDGEAYEPKWDVSAAPPAPAVVDARARAAARMLARLQAVEPVAAGLGDEPVLSPGDELERWAALYATAGDDLRGEERAVAAALAARVPEPAPGAGPGPGPGPARILHGDYRLGNMQFAGETLAAIIDWEIWSLGDPRHDLAWVMAFADPVQQRVRTRDAANQAAADAMPAAEELLGEYLGEAGLSQAPPDLDWFVALAYYKLGATMSVLAKRNRAAAQPDPSLEVAAETTPPMLDRALALLR